MLPAATLDVVELFLRVYEISKPMLYSTFDSVDSNYTLYTIDEMYDRKIRKLFENVDCSTVDPRFCCTKDAYNLYQMDKMGGVTLRNPLAKFRCNSIKSLKCSVGKVKLNWDHFEDYKIVRYLVRPKHMRSLSDAVLEQTAEASQKIQRALYSEKETLDYFEEYMKNYLSGGFLCVKNKNREKMLNRKVTNGGARKGDGAQKSSNFQTQVFKALETVSDLHLESEIECGPFRLDIKADSTPWGSPSL